MAATRQQFEEEEGLALAELQPVTVVESLIRGEIDTQVRTAKAYPRSVTRFRNSSKVMVSLDQETAEACIYSMPRGGKPITGPSVRFAEIILSAWGNSRAGYRPIEEGERHVTAQGVFADLENNTAITAEVRRNIMGKNGKRFTDDMINVTMNAAGSIALRNAILRGIPQALWLPVYNAAKEVAIGNASTLVDRRAKVVEYFGKMGVGLDRILYRLERAGVDDINLDDLEILTGLKTAIKDGTPVDQAFPPVGSREAAAPANGESRADALTQKLRQERQAAEASAPEPAPEAEPEATEFRPALSRYRDAFAAASEAIGRNKAQAAVWTVFETPSDEATDEQLDAAAKALSDAVSKEAATERKKK